MKYSSYHWMKYLAALLVPVGTGVGMVYGGISLWYPVIIAFLIVPAVELILPPDSTNLDPEALVSAAGNRMYDLLIWLLVPFQWLVVYLFLIKCSGGPIPGIEMAGMIVSMGLLCGIVGINVGHELGHRTNKTEQLMAKILLLSSLYMHFFIEHNRGHHKKVGTPDDPASARYNESLYSFWFRSVINSYLSAWKLERQRLLKEGAGGNFLKNEMVIYHLTEIALLVIISLFFGWKALLCFVAAALIGILLLEAVNYIEHYGIARIQKSDGNYRRTLHCHSWNSDHLLGRTLLFELSRHSDHHYKASKKYQLLEHLDESPQMPTGYSGMIILALIPPLWFRVMNARLEKEMKRMPEIGKAVYA